MRASAVTSLLLLAALTEGACSFSARPASGEQSCSNDNPPQCPDGYACVAGLCYENGHLPATGDVENASMDSGAEADAALCKPSVIVCGTGSGKRCGKVSDPCAGTTECGACIAGESCGAGHVCSVACGQAGQPCCTGSTCTAANTVCTNGTCAACGGANQLCCSGNACSALGATCADTTSTDVGTACLLACATTTGACVSGTDLDCATLCGPGKIGSKTCTCASDAWKCPACNFPAGADYACYKLPPNAVPPLCDANTPPTAGDSCTLSACSACGSANGKGFIEVGGAARAGFCVCMNNRWTCALTKDWPCPGNPGC